MQKKPEANRFTPVPQDGAAVARPGLHPRNRHTGRYDFARLIEACPELAPFVSRNAYGDDSIDFANPAAVRSLNRALLGQLYGIRGWELPAQYLCPPVPGRADYLHHAADLLADCNQGSIPCGASIRVLDIGVGANCIYPLIGHSEYGWRFVGTDIDRNALDCARAILDANAGYREAVELRLQRSAGSVFRNTVQDDESFDLVICNPPFHASMDEARAGTERKWRNLGKPASGEESPVLNFGGQGPELHCEGGEEGFIGRMIAESLRIPFSCLWFTALVSRASSLPALQRALERAGAREVHTIDMAQGQKKSRIVAWTFLDARQKEAWRDGVRGESALS